MHKTFHRLRRPEPRDGRDRRRRRLTRGERAYDPDVAPDGSQIVFARKLGDRSELVPDRQRRPGPENAHAVGSRASSGAALASTPRRRPIVAARLLPGGWLDLVLVDPATGAVRSSRTIARRTSSRASRRTARRSCSARTATASRTSTRCACAIARSSASRTCWAAPSSPSVSPDGRTLAYADYSSLGYDVRVAPLDLAAALAASAASSTRCRRRGPPRRGVRAGHAVPSVVDAAAALLVALDRARRQRRSLRLRDRRLGRAVQKRLGCAPHLRHRHRAPQPERLLPLRPLPPEPGRERPGHHERRRQGRAQRTQQLNLQLSLPVQADDSLDPQRRARLPPRARAAARQQRSRGPRRLRRPAGELDLVERARVPDVDLALRGLAAARQLAARVRGGSAATCRSTSSPSTARSTSASSARATCWCCGSAAGPPGASRASSAPSRSGATRTRVSSTSCAPTRRCCAATRTTRSRTALRRLQRRVPLSARLAAARLSLAAAVPAPLPAAACSSTRRTRGRERSRPRRAQHRGRRLARRGLGARLLAAAAGRAVGRARLPAARRHAATSASG